MRRIGLRWCNGRGRTGTALACVGLAVLGVTATGRLEAQQQSSLLSGFDPAGDLRGGPQLYGITGFAGWESVVNPAGGFNLPAGTDVKGDETYGGAISVGWARRGQENKKTRLWMMYTASYMGRVQYSNLNALNQYFTLGASRRLSRKWTAGFTGSAALSTYDQMLFRPTVFGSLAAAPGSFEDLSAAILAGQYNNDQLASLLTGAPVIDSPSRTLFFGNRVFVSSAEASLSYRHSSRLTLNLTAGGSLIQHMNDGHQQDAPQYLYLLPRAIQGNASLGLDYALSPRTQIGFTASSTRGFSRIQNSYVTTATAFIGRNIGQHWFAQVHAGGGFITSLRSQYRVSTPAAPVFGGTLGVRLRAHTVLVESSKTLGQTFGVGSSNMISTNAAWHWWRPGRSWGLNSEYMRMQFSHGAFGSATGWRSAFGVTRRMGRHMMVETAYTYASYANESTTLPMYDSAQHAVRLSIMWRPAGRE